MPLSHDLSDPKTKILLEVFSWDLVDLQGLVIHRRCVKVSLLLMSHVVDLVPACHRVQHSQARVACWPGHGGDQQRL